jgi:hypothetical protein
MLIYSAKLLFQFRRVAQGRARKRVLCEERVVSFKAPHRKAALARAKRLGRAGEHDYDAEGGHIFFEFLGVMELRDMTIVADEGEVWYEFVERLQPRQRLKALVPLESKLEALRMNVPKRRRLA